MTYRRWWLTGLTVLIAVGGAFYYTRTANRWYRVNAVVTLNGPTTLEVKNYYGRLGDPLPDYMSDEQTLQALLNLDDSICRHLRGFRSFYVIDNQNDGTADFIDRQNRNSGTDTMNVRMTDMLALQFETRHTNDVPLVEKKIMAYLNAQPQFIRTYENHRQHTERQYLFDSIQVEKLDSMTSRMYRSTDRTQVQTSAWDLTLGRQQIVLPVKDIEQYMERKQIRDTRRASVTAPVVLQGHFTVCSLPINSRGRWCVTAFVLGWLAGCLIAYAWEEHKRWLAYLRR